jgi:hypothetical protein
MFSNGWRDNVFHGSAQQCNDGDNSEMSTPKKDCEDCGNPMTFILSSFACDWCDGLVADEWDKSSEQDTTEPGLNPPKFLSLSSPLPLPDLYDDNGYFDLSDIDLESGD